MRIVDQNRGASTTSGGNGNDDNDNDNESGGSGEVSADFCDELIGFLPVRRFITSSAPFKVTFEFRPTSASVVATTTVDSAADATLRVDDDENSDAKDETLKAISMSPPADSNGAQPPPPLPQFVDASASCE